MRSLAVPMCRPYQVREGGANVCVIAGYVGSRLAAPVLLDMIERQEGLAGGYYAGLAVVEPGSMHWCKVVGLLADLREKTSAAILPGCVGVAHSRSKSGGDAEWAHPFVACFESVAYVANGSAGVWEEHPSRKEIPNRLAREGHMFHAISARPIGKYPVLDDGRTVHASDVMAHLVEDALRRTGDPQEAIATAMVEMPSEIASLFVSPHHPEAVYGARWNLPACVGMDDEGAYVASSPEGFPPSVRWWRWIPPSSSFTLSRDRVSGSPLGPASQAIVDDVDRGQARAAIVEALSQGKPLGVGSLLKIVEPLSPSPAPKVRYDPVYDVLYSLIRSGQVCRKAERVPGAAEGIDGLRFMHTLAKDG